MDGTTPYFYTLISLLLAIVAYFLKQLLLDFRRVEKDVGEVKTTMALIKAEFKGINDLMNQKLEYLEHRIRYLEENIKQRGHENERNEPSTASSSTHTQVF